MTPDLSASRPQSDTLGKVRSAGRERAARRLLLAGGPESLPQETRRRPRSAAGPAPRGRRAPPRPSSASGPRPAAPAGRGCPPPSRGPAARTAGCAALRGTPRPPMAGTWGGPERRGRAGCRGRRGYVIRPGDAPMAPPVAPKLAARAGEWLRARGGGGERVQEARAGPRPGRGQRGRGAGGPSAPPEPSVWPWVGEGVLYRCAAPPTPRTPTCSASPSRSEKRWGPRRDTRSARAHAPSCFSAGTLESARLLRRHQPTPHFTDEETEAAKGKIFPKVTQ